MSVEQELEAAGAYSPIQRMRHSAAHVMAEAVQELFPGARFAIGPAIEDGFYYDMELPRPLTPEDLPAIEERMRASIAANHPFVHSQWPRKKALKYFRSTINPTKSSLSRTCQARGRHRGAGAIPGSCVGVSMWRTRARLAHSS